MYEIVGLVPSLVWGQKSSCWSNSKSLLSATCDRAKTNRGGQNLSSWERNLSDHVLYGCGIFKPLVEGIYFVS